MYVKIASPCYLVLHCFYPNGSTTLYIPYTKEDSETVAFGYSHVDSATLPRHITWEIHSQNKSFTRIHELSFSMVINIHWEKRKIAEFSFYFRWGLYSQSYGDN